MKPVWSIVVVMSMICWGHALDESTVLPGQHGLTIRRGLTVLLGDVLPEEVKVLHSDPSKRVHILAARF